MCLHKPKYFYIVFESFDVKTTVKLGYNELGYNKLPPITNKFESLVGFQSFVPLFLGYNEQNPGEQMISLLTKISDLRFVLLN